LIVDAGGADRSRAARLPGQRVVVGPHGLGGEGP
jgi:hypothetical protein